jgi:hypothetical protein
MAKAPVPGRVKTRLCPPLTEEQAASLAHGFLLDALARARTLAAAALYLAYSPPDAEAIFQEIAGEGITCLPQEGDDLGQRMDRLSRRLLAAGHPAVAIIGTDTPTLPVSVLADALDRLAGGHADLVLGPSEDGGYYLIGMRRPLHGIFADIAWGGPTVLADTRERAAGLGLKVSLLQPWFDVDTPEDLARLRDALRAEPASAEQTRRCLEELFPVRPAGETG